MSCLGKNIVRFFDSTMHKAILIASMFILLVAASCAKPYEAQIATVKGLLSAARLGDLSRAEDLMPSLVALSPQERKTILDELSSLGDPEFVGVAPGPGGYVVSLRFGKSGTSRTIAFPVLSERGSCKIGEMLTITQHIDMVPLEETH